ncbi:MAG TPA: BPTI/Kunitz domain-containing protein [Polyangiaceae bacterium]|nr:BPTI/Kunitz domain-containing protein [Polyangiaceae bacterium]
MTSRPSRFGHLYVGGLALALASACGGRSFVRDNGDEGGGSAHGGSGNEAGSTARAGSGGSGVSHAGQSTGGTGVGTGGGVASGGVSSGGSGLAGFGGVGDPCSASPDPGPCDAYGEVWWNDPSTGICRPYVYGGCGGTANRYWSLAECQKACADRNQSSPNYGSCTQATDCVVTGTGCCPVCESENMTVHDLIAYNRKYESVLGCFGSSTAPPPRNIIPPDGGSGLPSACAPCPNTGDGTPRLFVPDCVAGQCTVVDLRTSPTTACRTNDDCRLRRGTGCCETCSDENLVAVRNDGSFENLVCGGVLLPCDACELPTPAGAFSTCAAGHCRVGVRTLD